jgi:hypothetical protein
MKCDHFFPFLTVRSLSNDSTFLPSCIPNVMLKRCDLSFGMNFTFRNSTVESFPLEFLDFTLRFPIFITGNVLPPATITSSFTDFHLIRLLSLQSLWHDAPLSPTHKLINLFFSSPSSKLMKFESRSSFQISEISEYSEAQLASSLSSFLPPFEPFLFLSSFISNLT